VEALIRSQIALRSANIIVALTLEALLGSRNAFRQEIHLARPHRGQISVAKL
jgi:histidine ammonia-lyase